MEYIIKKGFKGSPDGHTVIAFATDTSVEASVLGKALADVALKEGWIVEKPQAKKQETKKTNVKKPKKDK
jgi:hypothetical protein